jgi:glycosyltransferase involved in cell wall biosynthesis
MNRALSVVMPLYNAEAHLATVLPPLRAALDRGDVLEVIVVDDGSTDAGARLCREAGLHVVPSGGRRGPGACRNIGVEAARGDLVLFVDSDVVMHPDVPARVQKVFAEVPGCAAVMGSYDDAPPAPGWISRYRNLLHHHTHQKGREEATTFWAGCGAVDRRAYLEVGGFDGKRYPHPSIEDIELGYRLRARGGRLRLDKGMQGTHLKRWTLRSMIHTDVFRRAIPWARLLQEPGHACDDLNLSAAERAKAALAGLFWASLAAIPFWPYAAVVAFGLLVAAWWANAGLFRLVRRRVGPWNMLAALLLHQLYYLYSACAYVYVVVTGRFRRAARSTAAR